MADRSIGSTISIPWTTGNGNVVLTYVGNNSFEVTSDTPATDARVQALRFVTEDETCEVVLQVKQLKGSADILIDCEDADSVATKVYNGGGAESYDGTVIDSGNASSQFNPQEE
jgi:hypothetical protein